MGKDILKSRLAKLIDVKSIVTLILTLVFSYLSVTGKASTEFLTIYTVVISFYFGTQVAKRGSGSDVNTNSGRETDIS